MLLVVNGYVLELLLSLVLLALVVVLVLLEVFFSCDIEAVESAVFRYLERYVDTRYQRLIKNHKKYPKKKKNKKEKKKKKNKKEKKKKKKEN